MWLRGIGRGQLEREYMRSRIPGPNMGRMEKTPLSLDPCADVTDVAELKRNARVAYRAVDVCVITANVSSMASLTRETGPHGLL